MSDVASILADVRSLANRGAHHAIVARYGGLDDTPEEETWNSTELLFEIGRAFGMLGNEEKVERYLLRCAELAPRRAAVFHCAIGWYFQRKKKWTKALRWYDRALASFPTYHLCLFRRGYCLEKLHRPRETVEALARARDIWEKAPSEQRQRGRGVQVQVLFHLSRALRDLAEFDAAADALDACCALDEGSDPPAIRPEHMLANRGELNLRRGDLEASATAFREARALDPASSYLCERLGRVHELSGDHAAAEAAYHEAAALPRGAFAFLALGRFQARVSGDLPGAASALVEALRRVPAAEPLVRVELARIELAVGRRTAALRQVERALACRREGGFAEGLRLAADICAQLGRAPDAHRYLEQLVRLHPGEADAAARAAASAAAPEGHLPPPPPDPALPPALAVLGDAAVGAPCDDRHDGIVDRFFPEKGFGFLRYGNGESIFFHVTQCEDGADGISVGTRVTFVVGHNAKKGKPQAEVVRRLT